MREPIVAHVGVAVAGCAGLATAAALVVAVVPDIGFAWHSPAVHVGIETTATVAAILAAYLLSGRYGGTQTLSDLALVAALVLLALTNLSFSTVPALLGSGQNDFTTWTPTAMRLLGAVGCAVAAFVPDLRLPHPRRAAAAALCGAVASIILVAVLIALLGGALPSGAGAPPSASDTPDFHGPGGFVVLHALTFVTFVAAAVGFTFRAQRTRSELTAWFAIAMGLAAVARVHYVLFPSVDPEAVFTGDIVRFVSYLALLVGALREIRHYQHRLAVAAVLEERRRMARDLHDGLAQELAFIASQSKRLRDDSVAERIADAAERALDESRSAIRALTRRCEDPFDSEVAEVAEQLVARAGARLRLDLQPNVTLPTELREPLLRIMREAVTNGLRHGKASQITIELAANGGVRMAVTDNGTGFDPSAVGPSRGFGLTSMRERAAALGGEVEVVSSPGEGTLVEVVVP